MTALAALAPSPVPGRESIGRVRRRLAILPLAMTVATLLTVALLVRTIDDLNNVASEFSAARDRADLVPFVQRELLRLEQEMTEAAVTGDLSQAQQRAGFALQELRVSVDRVSLKEKAFLADTVTLVKAIADGPMAHPSDDAAQRSASLLAAGQQVEQRERELKQLFDQEVRAFDDEAASAIVGKASTQELLALLIGATIVLAAMWALTARRRAQQHLRAASHALMTSEERFRSLVQLSSDLTVVIEGDGAISYASPAAAAVLGIPPDAMIGAHLTDFVHHGDDAVVTLHSMFVAANAPTAARSALTFRLRHGDGSWRIVEARARALTGDSKIAGILLNLRDMTEKVSLEAELRHAQKLESVGQLAAGIAHELNTPIQFVGDNIRFLSEAFDVLIKGRQGPQESSEAASSDHEDFLRAEVPEAIQQTIEGIDRVAEIVRAMRAFGHPGNEETVPVDLNKAISDTLVVAANELKYVADVVTRFGDVPLVPGHRGDINQVLLNLVVNAAHAVGDVHRATGARGTITISTRQEDDDVVIEVADTGTGIDPEIADRVFEPFFTTKPVGSGTGQGLALAYSLVTDRHQGSISFDSKVGEGTTFVVRLPITPLTSAVERRSGPTGKIRRLSAV